MELGLVLNLVKLSLEVFQDERRDRFLKKWVKLDKEYQDELAKDDDDISDLTLDRLRFELQDLAKLVVAEARRK